MTHLKYLRYIILHKWYVLLACWRRGLIWQGIVHDWSKFLPSEWIPYARNFYSRRPTLAEREQAKRVLGHDPYLSAEFIRESFNRAWLRHQHRSPHHWQYWVLREDSGATICLEMPRMYLLEMLADWEGAGRAITGKTGTTPAWYARNRDKMMMHPDTRAIVDREMGYDVEVPF